jgi:uncharacterized OB-fold protein
MSLPDFPPRFDSDIVRPYYAALARGELALPACSRCGEWQWYPFEYVRCHADAQHLWRQVPTTGTVYTFTVVHRGFLPNAERGAPPYVAALVELDGVHGPRLPCLLVNLGARAPAIGMRVRLSPLQRAAYTATAFEPAD